MLKSKDFWVGVVVGVALYYVYLNHIKGKKGGGGALWVMLSEPSLWESSIWPCYLSWSDRDHKGRRWSQTSPMVFLVWSMPVPVVAVGPQAK
jgi:hypothetical protein